MDGDWSAENGGRGRYYPGIADHKGDKNAYFKTVNDAKEACRKKGYKFSEP